MHLPIIPDIKTQYVDVFLADNTPLSLSTASILGGIPTKPQLVGVVCMDSQLGSDATTGAPHKVLGVMAEIDNATGIITVTAKYSAALTTRPLRLCLFMRE